MSTEHKIHSSDAAAVIIHFIVNLGAEFLQCGAIQHVQLVSWDKASETVYFHEAFFWLADEQSKCRSYAWMWNCNYFKNQYLFTDLKEMPP